jgi:hypothetical protein
MTIRYSPNTPVTNQQVQALLYYHWLTFCAPFQQVATNGPWNYASAGTDGVVNSVTPSLFTAGSGPFQAIHATNGWYLAIRDTVNPKNTTIAKITSYINPTSVQLNAGPTNFTISSTGLQYRLIDPTGILPGLGSYFVIQNNSVNQPWQAKILIRSVSPLANSIEFAPIGGWSTPNWTLPVCAPVLMYPTLVQSFMLADPEQGWVFFWTEETGGSGSNRKGCWFGALSPFHAPRAAGIPSDIYYGAIFGDVVGTSANNFSRVTSPGTPTNICDGQTMDSTTAIIPIYFAQKRFVGSGTDTNTLTGTTNPRSSEADSYDMIAFQKTPYQAFRGKVPGIRLLSNNLTNRTGINSTGTPGTYVIGNGIGVAWNGKPIV